MNKEQMIEKIYEVIADKTLSFGCKIKWYKREHTIVSCGNTTYNTIIQFSDTLLSKVDKSDRAFKIIWHPVMIWDVLNYIDWFTDRNNLEQTILDTVFIRWKKNIIINDQSTECIEFVYNLVSPQ